MLHLNTILAATDFSGCADSAVDLALDIARRHGAALRLIHIKEPNGSGHTPFGGGHALSRAWELDLLQSDVEGEIELAWDHVPVVAEVQQSQDPTEAILGAVIRHDVDLLVMGTHGQHSVRRFLNDTPDAWSIGLTARELLSETRCPVLAVGPRHRRRVDPPNHVVAGVDDSTRAEAVILESAAVARAYHAGLTVVHVVPPGTGRPRRAEARRELIARTRSLVYGDLTFDVAVPEGRPAESLVRFVRHRPGAVLVVASHGHSTRGTVRIGSVANAVVRSAPCPVLTIKPFGKSLVSGSSVSAAHVLASAAGTGPIRSDRSPA